MSKPNLSNGMLMVHHMYDSMSMNMTISMSRNYDSMTMSMTMNMTVTSIIKSPEIKSTYAKTITATRSTITKAKSKYT